MLPRGRTSIHDDDHQGEKGTDGKDDGERTAGPEANLLNAIEEAMVN